MPTTSAKAAGLHYVSDTTPGLVRRRRGTGFSYVDPAGSAVRTAATLRRIRALAIPPAWTDVWICLDEQGHIQATGRDAKGRKQYRYHARWTEVRGHQKFGRVVECCAAWPMVRWFFRRDHAFA